MTSSLIVGVDPGPIPGVVALAYADGRPLTSPSIFQCDAGSAVWLVGELLASTQPWDRIVLAVERFVVGPRSGRSSTAAAGAVTRDMVGALYELGRTAGVQTVLRTASDVMPWAVDARLKAAGLLDTTKGMQHARAASRHALFCAVADCGIPDPLSRRSTRPQLPEGAGRVIKTENYRGPT